MSAWVDDSRGGAYRVVGLLALRVRATDSARRWLACCGVAGGQIWPRRAALPDLPDYAADVAEAVQDWMSSDDELSHDGGWPVLDEAAFAATIRDALMRALVEHTDLSEAAWQPTGRTMTAGEARVLLWHPDGTPKMRVREFPEVARG